MELFEVEEAIALECRRRGYSERTVGTYIMCVRKFLLFTNKPVQFVGKKEAHDFLNHLLERKAAGNTLNVYHMAIRFFLEDILKKNMKLNIKYSRRPEKLPEFLTKEEVKQLIGKIGNWKHRLMIEVLYGGGLRVSELLNLKVKDLLIENGYGFIRQGKGRKDRIFVLSKITQDKIKNLIELEKLSDESFLFLTNRNEKYNVRSLQEIVKKATLLARIKKEVHPHTLRHSFATHLIQNGASLNEVQTLLGHKSPETSMIYVHMASPNMINIKSPLDNL
ncbi:MAG: tyrosine-type recombinase/integrase [archaeon]|nr:tyrosine-type recombinase/integrase [archaeon]